MKRILRLRQEIDEIDEAILQLLKKRIDVSKRIGKTKKILHLPLRDHDREDEIYLTINETASQIGLPPQTRAQLKTIYREIISLSLSAQGSNVNT